uniref:Complement C3 n=1 Tax=Calidris pygmaea TaxID=425635 RepID=A0A8C3PNK0_9CHAR
SPRCSGGQFLGGSVGLWGPRGCSRDTPPLPMWGVPRVTMVTPAVLRLETEEQVVVEAPGLTSPTEVTILVQDFPLKRHMIYQTRLPLTPAGGMLVSAKVLPQATGKQFVSVTARVAQVTLEKVLLVSLQSGHIFVQTDKPIYTPGSTGVSLGWWHLGVLVAPWGLGGLLDPLHGTLGSWCLGTWTIQAKFEDSPEQVFSTQFEVKEYGKGGVGGVLGAVGGGNGRLGALGEVTGSTGRVGLGTPKDGEMWGWGKQGWRHLRSPEARGCCPLGWGPGSPVLALGDTALPVATTGSDMVEAQRGDISIVTSPYTIHFTRTPKYFKPGMPFDLMVYVTNPDKSPAPRVAIKADDFQGLVTTQRDGTAKLVLNMPADKDSVPITVRTDQPGLPQERQASLNMVAKAYRSQSDSGNFLHLAVGATELQPGDNLPVNFHLKSNNAAVRNSIPYFTYLIMSKGRIVHVGRQRHEAGQSLVTMSLPVTAQLIPSFRIVAYYHVLPGEIVADSVWVDVKDTCMGTLVVKGATEADNRVLEPGTSMRLRIEGDHNAHVGLVAVDKGVFVLNKKHKLTQSKVWDTVEKSDIGCTAGSGRDNVGVFADAGLSLATNVKISTPQRGDVQCPQPAKRKRRSLQLVEFKGTKAAEYTDKALRKCCEDGMKENPMGHSCEKRTTYIQEGEGCVQAFLDCCNYIKGIRDQRLREFHLELARSDDNDDFLAEEDITSRSLFPESWLWQVERLTEKPNELNISTKTLPVFLKDSITTWEVLAVSLSPNKGLCVADPYEITVMKDFFIDLRLPYSVVRNEQVEIRAVLYNYWTHDITVRVELMHNPALCSASTSKARYQQILKLKAQSSWAVPFVIVPLQLGLHDVEVKAAVRGSFMFDGVKKKLKVVVSGHRCPMASPPMRGPRHLHSLGLHEASTHVGGWGGGTNSWLDLSPSSAPGNPVAILVEKAVDGAKLKHLITTPSGCGEQNMIALTPTVIATHYLDTTGQWESFGVDRRTEAIELIKKGYTQQLAFRKSDSSFAAFQGRPSSTWLTAYVAKVFAMAIKLVDIEPEVICGAIKWLILEKQKPDGIFQEDGPVIHKEMLGGYVGAEPEASLTAFVLVALLESRQICKDHVNSLEGSITKASEYLSRKYQSLKRPYTVALTSYALALAGKLNSEKVLMKFSKGGKSWEERNSRTYNIEGTSYALLALLQMEKAELTGPVARWLAQQNYFGGGYGSTQATILVFQALAQYQEVAPRQQELNLDVSVLLPRRASAITYRIENRNALVARSAETKLNEDFTVKAEGKGRGTMTVVTIYNAKVPDKEDKCDNFDLDVQVEDVKMGESPPCPVSSPLPVPSPLHGTPMSPVSPHCPRLSEGVDRYISKFEMDQALSDRSNLVIYLDKISHKDEECFTFKAHQRFQVGLIQPAAVTVYSYYKIDDRCTRFYHPDKNKGQLSKICSGDVCRCAEENCFTWKKQSVPITINQRIERACEPGVDYDVTCVSPPGPGTDEDPAGSNRTFVSHQQCRDALRLQTGQDYLLWGLATDLWVTGGRFSYFIGKDTWLEAWPSEVACQEPDHQPLCQDFAEFTEAMTMFGCPS